MWQDSENTSENNGSQFFFVSRNTTPLSRVSPRNPALQRPVLFALQGTNVLDTAAPPTG